MTDEYKETPYEVVEPTPEDTVAPEETVVENTLSDEEREVQERQEVQAEALAPGETLPWVAPTPSGAQPAENTEENTE